MINEDCNDSDYDDTNYHEDSCSLGVGGCAAQSSHTPTITTSDLNGGNGPAKRLVMIAIMTISMIMKIPGLWVRGWVAQ